jgi:hypothetical protein
MTPAKRWRGAFAHAMAVTLPRKTSASRQATLVRPLLRVKAGRNAAAQRGLPLAILDRRPQLAFDSPE